MQHDGNLKARLFFASSSHAVMIDRRPAGNLPRHGIATSTTAAEIAGGMWPQDNQRMSGFKAMATTQASTIGKTTGRAR